MNLISCFHGYVASIGKVDKDYVTGKHFTTYNQYPHAHVYEYSKCKLKTIFIYIVLYSSLGTDEFMFLE